jgi:shikimate kinase
LVRRKIKHGNASENERLHLLHLRWEIRVYQKVEPTQQYKRTKAFTNGSLVQNKRTSTFFTTRYNCYQQILIRVFPWNDDRAATIVGAAQTEASMLRPDNFQMQSN